MYIAGKNIGEFSGTPPILNLPVILQEDSAAYAFSNGVAAGESYFQESRNTLYRSSVGRFCQQKAVGTSAEAPRPRTNRHVLMCACAYVTTMRKLD